MPTFQFADKLGAPLAEALKKVVHARQGAGREPYPHAGERRTMWSPPARPTWSASCAARSPIRIWRTRRAPARPTRCAAASRATRCAGAGARATTGSPAWSTRRPGASSNGAATGSRRRPAPRHVLVVGGGPAGLEAARVAAERGHRVTLAEAGPQLGGAFRLAGLQPRRTQILELLDWYERELARLGVDVRLNTPIDADEVPAFGADAVVLATGSLPSRHRLPAPVAAAGACCPASTRPNVWSIEDVMGRLAKPGKRVVLIDDTGDWRGGGTAWHLAEQGHQVTIVSGWPMVGYWIQRTAGDGQLRARLAQLGARWLHRIGRHRLAWRRRQRALAARRQRDAASTPTRWCWPPPIRPRPSWPMRLQRHGARAACGRRRAGRTARRARHLRGPRAGADSSERASDHGRMPFHRRRADRARAATFAGLIAHLRAAHREPPPDVERVLMQHTAARGHRQRGAGLAGLASRAATWASRW